MNRNRRIIAGLIVTASIAGTIIYVGRSPPLAASVEQRTLSVNGVTRNYRVVIPAKLPSHCPVVFAFHGMGDTPDAMAAYTELDRVAVNEGFVLVYPSARRAMWSTVGVRQDNLAQNADVQFFDEILERVCSTYDVDRDRVYGVGMSNGATFVQILAHAMPSTLAAIVAHSGMRPLDIETPASLTPLLLIVGSDDTAPRRIKEDFDHYRSNGHNARLIVVDGLEHRWSTCHNATMWNFLAKHDVRE